MQTLASSLTPTQAKEVLDREQGTLVDVRDADEFAYEHIAGATLLPLGTIDAGAVRDLPKPLIISCQSGARAEQAAKQLASQGVEDVHVLQGALMGWKQAGLPTEKGRKVIPVPRQMQIMAGSLILTGVALGFLVAPWGFGLSAFVGAGLLFAGVTGICPSASLLKLMPWNR